MLTQEQARAVMEDYLQKLGARKSYQLVILDSATREVDFGWVFFYNTEQYVKTRDPNWALGGNAPVIVDRDTGALQVTGTAESLEYYIQAYRQKRKQS